MEERKTIDPIKKEIRVKLRDPIPGKQSWIAFQIICHAFAAANNAAIRRISKISEHVYLLEVLIRDRVNITAFDPFIDDWTSNRQKRKEEYLRFLKKKRKELEKESEDDKPEPTSQLPPDPNKWCR